MIISDWIEFQLAFKMYIMNTEGLFTLKDPRSLIHFYLDAFLKRIEESIGNNGVNISITQAEMLMALSTFIDIEESYETININILPHLIKLRFKKLIENNWIQLSPYSQIKKGCLKCFSDLEAAPAA